VLIENGKIAAIAPHGTIKTGNAKKFSAKGMWVTPGFLDTHTHYDAEIAISPGLTESVRHGVTSVVVGSCSVSFVSSSPEDCADMFTRVEAVPREVVLPLLKKIKKWDSPSGYREWIDKRPLGPNVASFMGHSDLRVRAMGLRRSVTTECPTAEEQKVMQAHLAEALDAGVLKPGAQADVVVIDPQRLDASLEQIHIKPWSKGYTFDRLVNGGEAARHVFIAGNAAITNGNPTTALGKKRMGRFLESTF
jgi:N-acyl-D-aspartate/D-glutamate deacylase